MKYKENEYRDLTNLKSYAIDDESTDEVDDAISLEKTDKGFKVWIHVSSTFSHIKYGSELEKKARFNASTIYLGAGNQYMFPIDISKQLLSINKYKVNKTLSVGIEIDLEGTIVASEITQAYINLTYRLSYEDADLLIDYAPPEEDDLLIISKLLDTIKKSRERKGAIIIEETNGRFKLIHGKSELYFIEQTASRRLISESMILYGKTIAEFAKTNKIPIIYRVQDKLNSNIYRKNKYIKNDKLRNFLIKYNLPKSYFYTEPREHSGLGLSYYAQASSPIRRYFDYLVQNQVSSFLNGVNYISKVELTSLSSSINSRISQNNQIYMEDQRKMLIQWLNESKNVYYKAYLLMSQNLNKSIFIIYIDELKVNLRCRINKFEIIEIGSEMKLRYIKTKDEISLPIFEYQNICNNTNQTKGQNDKRDIII